MTPPAAIPAPAAAKVGAERTGRPAAVRIPARAAPPATIPAAAFHAWARGCLTTTRPVSARRRLWRSAGDGRLELLRPCGVGGLNWLGFLASRPGSQDRKSTRLNSSHANISYA